MVASVDGKGFLCAKLLDDTRIQSVTNAHRMAGELRNIARKSSGLGGNVHRRAFCYTAAQFIGGVL